MKKLHILFDKNHFYEVITPKYSNIQTYVAYRTTPAYGTQKLAKFYDEGELLTYLTLDTRRLDGV